MQSVPSMLELPAYQTAVLSHVLVACSCECGFEIGPPLLGSCLARLVAVAIVRGLSVTYVLFLRFLVLVGGIFPIPDSPYSIYVR